jgi:hypothetical protein
MRSLVGQDWPSTVHEVDRSGIRMWARAVGFDDPVFYDEQVARDRGLVDLPAPPGYLGTPQFLPGAPEPGPPIRGLNPALTRSLNAGTHYEYLAAIHAGDVLEATTRIVDLKQRHGSIGPFVLITRETTYARGGEVVARVRATAINY